MDDAPVEGDGDGAAVYLMDVLEAVLYFLAQGFRFFWVLFLAQDGKGGVEDPGDGGICSGHFLDDLPFLSD